MSGIQWSDPPAASRRDSTATAHAAAVLRSRPGEWAMVTSYDQAESAYTLANRIRHAKILAWRPAGAYEAATGPDGDGCTGVWARYVGEDGAE